MTGRDDHLWLQLWREQRSTEFHQSAVNPLLARFWPDLKLAPQSRIFVPLCGKSLDLIWLAEQGHEVIGVELSPLAVQSFFAEQGWQPIQRQSGAFSLWQYQNISILCGDYFALNASDLGAVDVVYDRAALTALSGAVRQRYIEHLRRIVPQSASVFLLTIEDAAEGDSLQQALGIDQELECLCAPHYQVELTHVESLLETNTEAPEQAPCRVEYKVYRLSGRPAP